MEIETVGKTVTAQATPTGPVKLFFSIGNSDEIFVQQIWSYYNFRMSKFILIIATLILVTALAKNEYKPPVEYAEVMSREERDVESDVSLMIFIILSSQLKLLDDWTGDGIRGRRFWEEQESKAAQAI
jgi:hypothetical protein